MNAESAKNYNKIVELLQSPACADLITSFQTSLTAFQAIPPEHGGDGEEHKALWVEKTLRSFNFNNIQHCDAIDERVSCGKRLNLFCKIDGEITQTLWIFGHLDVVSAGDLAAWMQDPFVVKKDGDWLIGRGVEDNQQAIVSMLILAWALAQTNIRPKRSLGLVFMSDEENGSKFGLAHVLKENSGIFKKDDLYLVPDFGASDAANIEVAEKAQLWVKIEVEGQQCHASTPERGKNAFVAACELVTHLHTRLPELYPAENELFSPKTSTFVPSRHEANVNAINIVPGRDVFYLDCRLVPEVSPQNVMKSIRHIIGAKAKFLGVKATASIVQEQPPSQIDPNHSTVQSLITAIKQIYGVDAHPVGVGGGTVAAYLRALDLPAIVWACLENTCHQPNERSSITATGKDSCVFAHLLFND